MVGVKGYDAAILEALTRHGAWIVSKASNANTITHYLSTNLKTVKRIRAVIEERFPECEIQVRKVAVVPVYIGYDKVWEIGSYLKELRGAKKKKERVKSGSPIRQFLVVFGVFGF